MLNDVPAFRDLRRFAALIGFLSNDLFSYAKEKHSDYNLINAYLKTGESATLPAAVDAAIARVNTLHRAFRSAARHAERQIAPLDPATRTLSYRYLDALEVIIASCYHWQKSTNRYRHPENVFTDMRA